MRNFCGKIIKGISFIYAWLIVFLGLELMASEVPDKIYVTEGEIAELNVDFPFVIRDIETELGEAEKKLCSIFGIIPVKEVTVNVVEEKCLYVSGEIVGIYTNCDGVFVIDTCEIESQNGQFVNPAGNVVKKGDYILAINGEELTCKEDVVKHVAASKGEKLKLKISREGAIKEVTVTPVFAKNGEYMLGIWVKDDQAGVGTITYISPSGEYGTLGHGMSNGETKELLDINGGDLYVSKIVGIEKGKKGEPGEVKGVLRYGFLNHLGSVEKNTDQGVFGTLDVEDLNYYLNNEKLYEVAHKQDIRTGKAQIVSDISGEREVYDIEITYVDYLAINSNKGLHIEITDPDLLELTGGIVQGMSGSPIIQNEKIIGAVTHVLVNDPKSGYGIFIEEMLEK